MYKVHLLLHIWDRQNLDQSNNWAVAYKTDWDAIYSFHWLRN